mgnify:CR=1 FL=1
MVVDIVLPVVRLFALTMGGFLLFKIRFLQRHVLGPLVWVTLNIILALYFIHTLPTRWEAGMRAGWIWMVVFFASYLVFLGVQFAMGRVLINRVPLLRTEFPRELLVIFAMHNAGYIPLPIIAALAVPAVTLYLSFHVMAFMFFMFTVAVWII